MEYKLCCTEALLGEAPWQAWPSHFLSWTVLPEAALLESVTFRGYEQRILYIVECPSEGKTLTP